MQMSQVTQIKGAPPGPGENAGVKAEAGAWGVG
jgi:hypothetical protein